MTRRFTFAVPGDLATPTGGYAYDRRMIAELKRLGWEADVIDIGSEFPRPSAAARAAALARLEAVPHDGCMVVDGLALGALPDEAAVLAEHYRLVALVHHPLALESGLSRAEAEALRRSERAALASTRHVIVTGAVTARLLASDYGVAPERISIALPGTDRVQSTEGSRDGTPALLGVGALVPRKGYDVLLAALATLTDLPWRLTVAGARDRNARTVAALEAAVARLELQDRVDFVGAVSDEQLDELYRGADVFVQTSYFEGYGMAVAQAIAHGVPVVATSVGAIPDIVPGDAGILVRPDDGVALAAALRRVIESADERRLLTRAARAAATRLPTWTQSAKIFSGVLEAVT